jgi:DNA polymerase III gamma/tau subunit
MSYHLDYRPNSFDNYLGNKATVKSLKALLSKDNHPHSYLFYGESGCGKTTLARIVASFVGCTDTDIQEINMSNNRGIDTAREIIERCHLSPMFSQKMIIILDEVHKSTNEFQNAMLKVLEEPPKHVYFILCTTDPNKLIPTVRKRCTPYEIKKLNADETKALLAKIVKDEKIKVSNVILDKITKKVDGCPRDSLVLLEKVKDLDEDEVDNAIIDFSSEKEEIISLCRRLLKPDTSWNMLANALSKITDEPEAVRRAVLGYCSAVLLREANSRAALIIDCFKGHFYDSGRAGLIAACYEVICG